MIGLVFWEDTGRSSQAKQGRRMVMRFRWYETDALEARNVGDRPDIREAAPETFGPECVTALAPGGRYGCGEGE